MDEKLFAALIVVSTVFLAGCANFSTSTAPYIVQNWADTQLKITYIGTQEKIVPSVGISVNDFDLSRFSDGVQGIDYSNDKVSLKAVRISEEEMKLAVNSVFALDFIENSASDGDAVSFTFFNATDGTAKEFLLNGEQAKTLAGTIRNSISQSSAQATPLQIYS